VPRSWRRCGAASGRRADKQKTRGTGRLVRGVHPERGGKCRQPEGIGAVAQRVRGRTRDDPARWAKRAGRGGERRGVGVGA